MGSSTQMTMAGTMLLADSNTSLLNTMSSHLASVRAVTFCTIGTISLRHNSPAAADSRMATMTIAAWMA